MHVLIAAVGRLKDGAERTLVDRYVERLSTGRKIGLGPVKESEIPESRAASADLRKSDEAQRLLALAASCDLKIALDERGKTMSSAAFAQWLGAKRDAGAKAAAFIIGGPDGQGDDVRQSAQLLLSLGPMTLPHGLARAVLAEQLYRAVTILSGHPYHRT